MRGMWGWRGVANWRKILCWNLTGAKCCQAWPDWRKILLHEFCCCWQMLERCSWLLTRINTMQSVGECWVKWVFCCSCSACKCWVKYDATRLWSGHHSKVSFFQGCSKTIVSIGKGIREIGWGHPHDNLTVISNSRWPLMLWLWAALQDCGRGYFDESESYKCANDISDRKGHMADRMRPLPLPSDCYLEIPLTDRWYYDCERGNSSCRCCLKITFLLHGSNGDTQYRYPENIQGPMTKSARLLQSRWPTPMSCGLVLIITLSYKIEQELHKNVFTYHQIERNKHKIHFTYPKIEREKQ